MSKFRVKQLGEMFTRKYRFSPLQRLSIWEAFNKKCIYCDAPISFKELHIDHIIPEGLQNKPEKYSKIRKE